MPFQISFISAYFIVARNSAFLTKSTKYLPFSVLILPNNHSSELLTAMMFEQFE
jgi:hypothetical protein